MLPHFSHEIIVFSQNAAKAPMTRQAYRDKWERATQDAGTINTWQI